MKIQGRRAVGTMVIILLFFVAGQLSAQEGFLMYGTVFDRQTGETLVGASIQDAITGRGVVSGAGGNYSIRVTSGQARIRVAYLGYRQVDSLLELKTNRTGGENRLQIDFYLVPMAIEYEEVQVTADAERDYVESLQMSEVRIKQEEIINLPALLGESDPVRFLQLTPGVQSSTEGGIGFFVRGGGADQNLVLFDNSVIYNPGHLLGFLSVFNPDIINEVSLLKSGIPARYGGRLSSVVRVNPSRGASDSLRVRGQIGLISSRISLNRSFNKNRGSFYVSARRASVDLVVKPLIVPLIKNSSPYFKESNYNFYDFNGGISHRVGQKDWISLSGYYGNDMYEITRESVNGRTNMDWGNGMATLRWTHIFSESLSLGTTASFTEYNFDLVGGQSDYSFGLLSNVRDYALKTRLNLSLPNHNVSGGIELTRHRFTPNEIDVNAQGFAANYLDFNEMHAWEGGVFLEDEFNLTGQLSFGAGLRYSFFQHMGPFTEYIKDENSQVIDSITYPAGESLAFYHHLEPRISLKYQLNPTSSLKASYMHMAQYVHLATSSTISLPSDIWLPSTKDVRPQTGDQLSLGYFRKFLDGQYEASLEGYYKRSRNQVEFIRGVINNSLNQTLYENIAFGDGRSYGGELFLRRKTGRLTGWIGYSLSRTERQFEKINEGKIYPAKYDRRHDLSLAGIYQLNKLWSFSTVFIYVSGNAMTIPIGRYMIQGNLLNEYGRVNNFRMPAYHRLDISATRTRVTRRGNISSWNFSIYNLYNRANPFYIYFETTGDLDSYQLQVTPVMVSLFPVIPSIAWRFEF